MNPQTPQTNTARAELTHARVLRFSPVLICLYFLVLTWNYARVTPVFEASDEAAHFLNIYTLIQDGELPRILSREQIAAQTIPTKLWAIETHQPPLYYALAAPLAAVFGSLDDVDDFLRSNDLIFIKGVTTGNHNKWLHSPELSHNDTYHAVMAVRALSMLMGLGTLLCVYGSAFLIFEDRLQAALAMILVASIPTFVAISSSVNNDNLVTLLYSAGIYWSLRIWKNGTRRIDVAMISGILAAIALTKLSGLSLIVVIYGALIVGVWRGRFTWSEALRVVVLSITAMILFAGWWYLRNMDLYGDPLALDATQALWGREYEIAGTSGNVLEELIRIARSLWLMIGHLHLPVYGPGWFYGYAALLVLLALLGWLVASLRRTRNMATFQRDSLLLSLAVCTIVGFTLLFGTRSVDISYGRLLFPALIGFAILVVWGISSILMSVYPKKDIGLFIILLPLIGMAIYTPVRIIPVAYPRLEKIDDLPDSFTPLNVTAETIHLMGFEVQQNVVNPGEMIDVELVFQGMHTQNPALLLTAVDSITLERLGHVEVYPGMAPTDTLNPDQLYLAHVQIPLDEVGENGLSPRQVRIQMAWYSPSEFRDIPLTSADSTPLDTLLVNGPLLLVERYKQPAPDSMLSARFGDSIRLQGYEISGMELTSGDMLTIETFWEATSQMNDDWILTIQIVDAQNSLLTQADGEFPGLPTSLWVDGMETTESRSLSIPQNAMPGDYRLLVGWYRLSDFARLLVQESDGAVQDNLVELGIIKINE